MAKADLDLATRGRRYKAQKAEKWAFWLYLGDTNTVRALNRWSRTTGSMIGYPRG